MSRGKTGSRAGIQNRRWGKVRQLPTSIYTLIALMPSSTWKNRNIFEGVLRLEDSLTDALRNFLKYQSVRDALWRTLPENVRESVNFSLIEDTQTRSSGGHSEGIPDLVLYGPDFILVIEVKIGAEPTKKHQQNAYVPWIKKECRDFQKKMGFVVFLTPDDYPSDEAP